MSQSKGPLIEFGERVESYIKCLEKIADAARHVALTLEDHKLERTATALNRLLSEADALKHEMKKAMAADPEKFMQDLNEWARKDRT